jgi:uncharacterized protein (DUF2062 family)
MCPDVAYLDSHAPEKKPRCHGEHIEILSQFVIEVCSHPRELRYLKDKMLRWIANGIELGGLWCLKSNVYSFTRPVTEPEIVGGDFMVGKWILHLSRRDLAVGCIQAALLI